MMETPNLQTLLTLTGGVSPVPQSVFVWGTPSAVFSVGTHGDWVINAAGVEPVHFFLRFDGKMLHVAKGPTAAVLSVSGAVVEQTWRPLPVFSVISFGAAQLRVTCEPAAPRARSSAPPAPGGQAPAFSPKPQDHLQSTVPLPEVRRVRTEPIVLPDQRTLAQRSEPPVVGAATMHLPVGGPGTGPMHLPVGGPGMGPMHLPVGGPGMGATLVSPAGPQGEMSQVPSVRTELPPPPGEMLSTLSDQGALKAHAERVASQPNLAHASADAYLEAVRYQAGGHPTPAPPPPAVDAARAAAQGHVPMAVATPPAQPVPFMPPAAAPLPAAPSESLEGGKAKSPKEKSSWVMRITLILLPFAGYFAVFWEPPADAPPASEVSLATEPSATTTAGTATANGSAPTATSRSVAPGTSVAAPASAAALAQPSSSVPTPVASAVPSAVSAVAPVLSATGSATPRPAIAHGPLPINVNRQRDALNAAFEGKLTEALAHYEALATGPNAQVYSTAARLIRERAFRKP